MKFHRGAEATIGGQSLGEASTVNSLKV